VAKLTEEINRDEAEALPDEKKSSLFFSMLNGKTIEETIETSKGDFKVKYPKQKDIISIGRVAALMRAGIPAANFDAAADYEIQKCASLDVMVSSGPAWFENAKKQNQNFSWRNVPDAHFVDEVYAKALGFRQTIQEQLAGDQKPVSKKDDGKDAGSVSSDVGDGLFSGVAGSTSGTES
jgi:hypothetical protein